MNKTIELRKNCIILFIINIFVLLLLVLFKKYFLSREYIPILINVILVINFIFFVVGIIFNFILLVKPNIYNEKKSIIIMVISFMMLILINIFCMVITNVLLSSDYRKIENKLITYCDIYVCDQYEIISEGKMRDFIIKKTYLDYNGIQNDIEIHTKYNSKNIITVEATVYSQKELFSEMLIKQQINNYFSNFNINIEQSLIKKAFDNRFKNSIKKDNLDYKVREVYEEEKLVKIKTIITLKLKQD